MMLSDPLIVITRLAQIFDQLEIQYVVGGSIASSMYGIPRATQDVDLMANVKLEHVDRLTAALEPEFYVAAELIADAIRRQESFNVIHLQTMFKADVFVPADNEWSREEMSRARTEVLRPEGRLAVRFSSPEDTILHKLLYRMGGHLSDTQWNDVLGILRIQENSIDFTYLERWAGFLNISDLLSRARTHAGRDPR
ncbi:MAG TPA: hypothetical protein VE422_35505 [Terriglobia bacterium]|nr:hypothetical protein [Terriglobia bacterium]